MKDMLLTKDSGVLDVVFILGDFQMVEGDEGDRQALEFKYEFFQNDWALDLSFGIPYFGSILSEGFNAQDLAGIFERAALEEPYVESVEVLNLDFNTTSRILNVTGSILAKTGVVIPVVVGVGL